MSYRCLWIRASKSTQHSFLFTPRWQFPVLHPARSYAANRGRELTHGVTIGENDEREKGSIDKDLSVQKLSLNAEATDEAPSEERTTKLNLWSTLSAKDDVRLLYLPESPKGFGKPQIAGNISAPRRWKLLRTAYMEAASNRLHRRSAVISRSTKAEGRVKALSRLLYPYQRRPPSWLRNLRALYERNRPTAVDIARHDNFLISEAADDWFRELYGNGEIERITELWTQLPHVKRRRRWPHIVLRCLAVSTEETLRILLATHIEPFPPFEVVMDAMLYLKRVRGEEIKTHPLLHAQYLEVLSNQRTPDRWVYSIERRHLDLFLEDFSSEERKELFINLVEAEIDLSYHCLLIFMDFFTRDAEIDLALEALRRIDLDLRLQPDKYLLSRCTNLLKLDSITTQGESPNFRILPEILEAGLKLNLALHNIVMQNAVSLGMPAVAWDLFRYIQDHDMPTDARTYLVLMRDALNRQDVPGLQELLTVINKREDLYTNPYLVAFTLNVIRVLYRHQLKMSPEMTFSHMLGVYRRAFGTSTLRHLGLVSTAERGFSGKRQDEPDAATLAHVLWAFVQVQSSLEPVLSLWSRIEKLKLEGDPIAMAVARRPAFYDGFISFFTQSSGTLPRSLQVVQSMLDANLQPSATTWGILLLGFLGHGQLEAAERIRGMMHRQGLLPSLKTLCLLAERNLSADLAVEATSALRGLKNSIDSSLSAADPLQDHDQIASFAEEEVEDIMDEKVVVKSSLSIPSEDRRQNDAEVFDVPVCDHFEEVAGNPRQPDIQLQLTNHDEAEVQFNKADQMTQNPTFSIRGSDEGNITDELSHHDSTASSSDSETVNGQQDGQFNDQAVLKAPHGGPSDQSESSTVAPSIDIPMNFETQAPDYQNSFRELLGDLKSNFGKQVDVVNTGFEPPLFVFREASSKNEWKRGSRTVLLDAANSRDRGRERKNRQKEISSIIENYGAKPCTVQESKISGSTRSKGRPNDVHIKVRANAESKEPLPNSGKAGDETHAVTAGTNPFDDLIREEETLSLAAYTVHGDSTIRHYKRVLAQHHDQEAAKQDGHEEQVRDSEPIAEGSVRRIKAPNWRRV
jgi:pentatricopeptide repeat protein